MNKESQNKNIWLSTISEYILYSIIFLVPLFFDRRLGIVFSLSKVTILRCLIFILIFLSFIRIRYLRDPVPPRPPLFWPILTFLLLLFASTVTSIHPVTSFFGFYGRYEGFSTWLLYASLFFLAYWMVGTREHFRRVATLVTIAGSVMGIYGVIQRFGLDPYRWGGVDTVRFVIATIGQPNFAAAYVAMAFMFGLYFFLQRDGTTSRWITFAGLLLIFTCILFTTSRGGTAGFLVGSLVFLGFLGRNVIIQNWKRLTILLGSIVLIGVVTLQNPEYSVIDKTFSQIQVKDQSTLKHSRLEYIGPTGSRIETWQSVARIIADRPWLGSGPETLKMIFPQYENDRFRFQEGFHVKQDRSHNEVLDLAVTKGVPALLAYGWILFLFFRILWKKRHADSGAESRLVTASIAGAAAAYLAQNQFSFGVVAITSLFWVILGMGTRLSTQDNNEELQTSPGTITNWLVVAVGSLIVVTGVFIAVLFYRGDLFYKSGKTLTEMRMNDLAVSQFHDALQDNPLEGTYSVNLGLATLNHWVDTARDEEYLAARNTFQYGQKIDPFNADNFYIESRLLLMGGKNAKDIAEARRLAQKALQIDPYYAEVHLNLAVAAQTEKNIPLVANHYVQALLINPNLDDAYQGLHGIYRGTSSAGYRTALERIAKKYPESSDVSVRLAEAYQMTGDLPQAVKLYTRVLDKEPGHLRAQIGVGTIYVIIGNLEQAERVFRNVLVQDPIKVEALNGLGWIHEKRGDVAGARDFYRQTLSVDPGNTFAGEHLKKVAP